MTTNKEEFSSKDRWLIWILMAKDESVTKIEPSTTDDGRRVLLFYFEATPSAKDIHDRWLRGEPITVDARKLEAAERVFKNNIQLYNSRT